MVEQIYHGAKVKLLIGGKIEDASLNCTGNLLGVIGQLKNIAAIPYNNKDEGFELSYELAKRKILLLEIEYKK